MYENFRLFLQDDVERQKVVEREKVTDMIDRHQIKEFADRFAQESFHLNDCIFQTFPLHAQVDLLEPWIDDEYCWTWGLMQFEIMKLAYGLWPIYKKYNWRNAPRHYPHEKIFRCLESAVANLEKLRLHGREAFSKSYPCFHLFCLLPLMENGIELFEYFSAQRYGDAQEGLMFALAQFDMKNVNNLAAIRRVFQMWDQSLSSIRFESGTGILGDLVMTLQVWQRNGFNARQDNVLGPIINRHI